MSGDTFTSIGQTWLVVADYPLTLHVVVVHLIM